MRRWKGERYALLGRMCSEKRIVACNPVSKGKKNLLVIGDSHGLDALTAFYVAAPDFNLVLSASGGCPPLVPENLAMLKPGHPDRGTCLRLSAERIDPLYLRQFDVIAINVLFEWYRPDHLRRYLKVLREATGARLFLFGGFVSLKRDCSLVALSEGLAGCLDTANVKSYRPFEGEMRALSDEFGATFISKSEIFCSGGALDQCRATIAGSPATPDKHHLSLAFAREMGQWIKKTYGTILAGVAHSP